MKLPSKVTKGPKFLSQPINELIDAVTAMRPTAGKGIGVNESLSGSVITTDSSDSHTKTLRVCIDGVPYDLDVVVVGEPRAVT